jgi:hypothetical protein
MERADEAIATLWESFDVAGCFGVIPEGRSELLDGSIQAVFEIYKGIGGPKPALKLLSSEDFAGTLKKNGENLSRLSLQPDLVAVPSKFSGDQVDLKRSEANCRLLAVHALPLGIGSIAVQVMVRSQFFAVGIGFGRCVGLDASD